MRKKPVIDWSTVVMTGDPEPEKDDDPEPIKEDPPSSNQLARTVLPFKKKSERDSLEHRGRSSPLKDLLSGASMRARSNGARFTHSKICRLLTPGLDTLIYGFRLLVAVHTADDHAGRLAHVAYVIGDTSDQIERRLP
jgi:hypothetical protein